MIDVALLRDRPDYVREKIALKNARPELVDRFGELDTAWRTAVAAIDALRAEQKQRAEEKDIPGATALKIRIKEQEAAAAEYERERDIVWRQIPNLPSDDTPVGKDEDENVVVRSWGEPRKLDFEPLDHIALGERWGLIDTTTAATVSGARFAYLMREAALLEFALVQFVMRELTDPAMMQQIAERVRPGYHAQPFVPVVPPVMIRPQVFRDMARLDDATEDERYYFPKDDLYLVGSAEHTLGPLHMGQIIPEQELPIRYIGFSTSFRREAGSYGKDTRGILRVHQFDKLEMESFSTSNDGLAEHDFLVAVQEHLTQRLGIPYRIVLCCTGDQGDPDARHVDLEMWMPAQNTYRETHSADYMADYQARRLKTRVRQADGTVTFAHTNDATAFAIGRTLIAILENGQQADGTIVIPAVLQPFVGTDRIGPRSSADGSTA